MIKAITFDLWDTVFIDDSDEPKRKAAGRPTKAVERRQLVKQFVDKHQQIPQEIVNAAYDAQDAAFRKVWHDLHITWSVKERLEMVLKGIGITLPDKELAELVRLHEEMELEFRPDFVKGVHDAIKTLSLTTLTLVILEFENNVNDTGGVYNGTPTDITYTAGKFGQAIQSSTSSQVVISNLPFDKNTEVVTISAWIKWNGNNRVMPFGWNKYNIFFYDGDFGFNTYGNDVYGIPSSGFANTWKHLVVEFRKGAYGKIWVDGVPHTLSLKKGSFIESNAVVESEFCVFGYKDNTGFRDFGMIDQVSIINRALTDAEVKKLYNEGA